MFNKNFLIGVILAPVIFVLYNVVESKMQEAEQPAVVEEELSLTDINFVPAQREVYAPTNMLIELSKDNKDYKRELNLSEFADKPTIVHVWAPWCGACTGEMVELNSFAKECAGKVNLVAIGLDQQKGEGLREFYQEKAISHLKIYLDPNGALSKNLRAHGLPTTIFYSNGKEIGRVIGPIDWLKYQGLLKKKLGV